MFIEIFLKCVLKIVVVMMITIFICIRFLVTDMFAICLIAEIGFVVVSFFVDKIFSEI